MPRRPRTERRRARRSGPQLESRAPEAPTPSEPQGRSGWGWGTTGLAAAAGVVGAGWALSRRATTGWVDDGAGDPDRLVLPPGEEHRVRMDDGAELAVTVIDPPGGRRVRRRKGRPATVVLAHGWTNTRAVWAPVARQLLEAGHPVIAYDQRGHGQSTFGAGLTSMSRLGDDLAALLDHFGVGDVLLAGHSMGGFTIMAFALDHPDDLRRRVKGLVLAGTAAHGLGYGSLDQFAARLLGSPVLGWLLGRPRLGLVLLRGSEGRRPRRSDLVATRDLFVATPPAVRAACYLAFADMDLRPGLPAIDVPTLVLTGSHDSVTPPQLGRTIAAAIPGARFEPVPDAGHLLPLEAPDQIVAALRRLATPAPPGSSDEAEGADVPARSGGD